jgi:hypothetical protein
MDKAVELKPRPAVRLIFEYEGDEVRLVAQLPVEVAVPGFDLAKVPHPGHYVETRTAAGEPLSRVPVRDAFSTSAEVFPEKPGGAISRVDVAQPKGAFTVIVPAGAAAEQVALLQVHAPVEPRGPRPPTTATTPAPGQPRIVEMATFPLEVAGRRAGGNS